MDSKRSSWKWFCVKTAYRLIVTGIPENTDGTYTDKYNMIEERFVMFKARNCDEAIKLSKKEADKYTQDLNFKNVYGETVSWKFLKVCEAYELLDFPDKGTELFSSTKLIDKRLTDKELVIQIFGPEESEDEENNRLRFVEGSIIRELAPKF